MIQPLNDSAYRLDNLLRMAVVLLGCGSAECWRKKNIGKPYAGKLHVRFDEGAVAIPLLCSVKEKALNHKAQGFLLNWICVCFVRLDVSLGGFFLLGWGWFELLRKSQEVILDSMQLSSQKWKMKRHRKLRKGKIQRRVDRKRNRWLSRETYAFDLHAVSNNRSLSWK